MRIFPILLLALCCAAGVSVAEDEKKNAQDPIVGTWHCVMEMRGKERITQLTFVRAEDGTLSGTYKDATGYTAKLSDITFEKGALRFERSIRGRPLRFEGRVESGAIAGAYKYGRMESVVTGRRGKKAFDAMLAALRKSNARGTDLEADYDKNHRRGMPRDGFPVVYEPKLVPAAEAGDVHDAEPVLGVFLGGEAKAYPIGILGTHEMVHDTCGGQPILTSW